MLFSYYKLDGNSIDEVLSDYRFYPHSAYQEINQSVLKENFRILCLDKISKSSSAFYLTDTQSDCKGIIWTAFQEFDTQQFGWRTENIEGFMTQGDYHTSHKIKKALVKNLVEDCRKKGVCYLSHRTSSNDLSTIHALEQSGFIMMDGLLTLSLDLKKWIPKNNFTRFVFRHHRKEDLWGLKRIARESYIYDRFHADPIISKSKADRFHEVWIENSCRGLVDAVMVAEKSGKVVGFLTCNIDRSLVAKTGLRFGSVILLATAVEERSKGVASGLLNYALRWFNSEGVDLVEVGTQIRNVPASHIYEKAGFQFRATSLFFRKWLQK